MGNDEMKGQLYTFVTKKVIGRCPICESNVYEDNLFVKEENEEILHFSCKNKQKKKEKGN